MLFSNVWQYLTSVLFVTQMFSTPQNWFQPEELQIGRYQMCNALRQLVFNGKHRQ